VGFFRRDHPGREAKLVAGTIDAASVKARVEVLVNEIRVRLDALEEVFEGPADGTVQPGNEEDGGG
jgi:hypothetical protein